MNVDILGPLRVGYTGASIVPTAPKPRKVLALLAVRCDQVVTSAGLIEELWAERPPRGAATTLQTYILQVRNLIAAAGHGPAHAKDVLVTEHGGYRLDTGGGEVDTRTYGALTTSAHRALDAGNDALAATRFRDALALWRGPALVDVDAGPMLQAELQHLEASRLSVLSQCIEAEVRLGRHHEVIGEIAGLSAQYPTDEAFQLLYMLALCRAGRRGSALEVFQRLRTRMRQDLGVEPSAALRRVQNAILNDEIGFDLRARVPQDIWDELRVLQSG